jgi:two-component system KDP operon response regulator KdpE
VGEQLLLLDATDAADATLSDQLAERGFLVRVTWDLDEALRELEERPGFGVLIRAEDEGALDWCRSIRLLFAGPLLVLCQQAQEGAVVSYLEAGADSVLVEPVSRRELAARIRALLQKSDHLQSTWERAGEQRVGDVVVNARAHVARQNGRDLSLTPTEFRLLAALACRAGQVVAREELLAEVWGPDRAKRDDVLRIYVGYLRQKLGDDPARPRILLNQRGVGYRLAQEEEGGSNGRVAARA